jgi:hypothetical protein
MTVSLSALAGAAQQFFDDNGVPLSGGKLYSYAAGTTTPLATYTDDSGSTPHSNPIILDAAGRVPSGVIWLLDNTFYKFSLFKSNNTLIANWDDISGINGITPSASDVSFQFDYPGSVATTVSDRLSEVVYATDFGVVADGLTDDSAALANFWSALNATTKTGVLPTGVIRCAAPVIWDISLTSRGGVTVRGPALGACTIDVRGAPATADGNAQFLLTCSSGSAFYSVFSGFTVLGNNASGPAARLGKANLSDEFNGFMFSNIEFKNEASAANAIACEANGHFNNDFQAVTTNTGGTRVAGISLKLTRVAFCRFFGSFSGADVGLQVDGTFSFANVFSGLNIEEVNLAVRFAGSSNSRNTFIGGTFVANTCIDFQSGSGDQNLMLNPNLAPYAGGAIFSAVQGVSIVGNASAAINTLFCGGISIVRPPNANADVLLDVGSAAREARTIYLRNNSLRWVVRMDATPETGSDVGSLFVLDRYNDAGVFVDSPFYVERNTGWTVATAKLLGVGFFGAGPLSTRPTVTGSTGGNAALQSLLAQLSNLGLITNSTT